MHRKYYAISNFLVLIPICLLCLSMVVGRQFSWMRIISYSSVVLLLAALIVAASFPFLEFDIDENGIVVYQLKRKLFYISWAEIGTAGIIYRRYGENVYVALGAHSRILELADKESPFSLPYAKHIMNRTVWRRGGLALAKERDEFILLLSDQPSGHGEQFLNKVMAQNYRYATKNGVETIAVYRFSKVSPLEW